MRTSGIAYARNLVGGYAKRSAAASQMRSLSATPVEGTTIVPPVVSGFLLLENSFFLLTESGDKLILE